MERQTLSVVLILGIGALVITNQVQASGRLVIGYNFPKNMGVRLGNMAWTQPVFITNPTIENIRVQAMNFQVLHNGSSIGTFYTIYPVAISKGQTVKKDFEVKIPVSGFATILADLFGKVVLEIKGQAVCYGFNVPLPSQKFNFNFFK